MCTWTLQNFRITPFLKAAKEFSCTHGDSKLKEIHFVNNDKASFDAFQRQFNSKFGSRSSVKTNFLSRPIPRKRHVENNGNSSFGKIAPSVSKSSLDEVIRERKPADHILIEGNIKIYIVVGDLSKHRVWTCYLMSCFQILYYLQMIFFLGYL